MRYLLKDEEVSGAKEGDDRREVVANGAGLYVASTKGFALNE